MENEIKNQKVYKVKPSEFAKLLNLDVVYVPEKEMIIDTEIINRPGLFLSGFYGYFPNDRIQLLGKAEYAYLRSIKVAERMERYEKFFGNRVPCVISSWGSVPSNKMVEIAKKYEVPLFTTKLSTTKIESVVMDYIATQLAEEEVIHGDLLDISGIGVLIVGDSGIGKSETALELVHRGHMLVADDLVNVSLIKGRLYGTALEKIKNFIEIRGVGIIDVEAMYGIGSVLNYKEIQLVIQLEKWNDSMAYDRLGNDKYKYNILGQNVPKEIMPVTAGRNLAIVIEAAVRNFRLGQMGQNSLDTLLNRIQIKEK